jgi:N-acetyl-gamma-glutamyl-phosphate reductase
MSKKFSIGIVGVSGYGGGEALRICASHPHFQITHVAGDSSAGQRLGDRFPALNSPNSDLVIQKWNPDTLPELDVLFASLPTGQSKEALSKVSPKTRIVDIGGDHRFAPGWTYGLADIWPDQICKTNRIANPGCYPSATLTALAPLVANGVIDTTCIIVDAKSGVSGAGRGGGDSKFGYSEVNEDVTAYGFFKHAHVPEMTKALQAIGKKEVGLTFTPHLVPMTRGILSTCYLKGSATAEECLNMARKFYEGRAFVKVTSAAVHSKWAMGSNCVFISYQADPSTNRIIAMGGVDNLGKGAAGQAVQNANLMLGGPETAGLEAVALWP